MHLLRTTLRLRQDLKKIVEQEALAENTTLQNIFNKALEDYLVKKAKRRAKKIVFKTHDLGIPLNNLKRKDFYSKLD